ncbi:AraC family transcriptional regulator [Rhizobium sp. SSA_523]|uniref:AraC family transcriptional regulator n=1 Tax=Rhizobium sp. SSA_523 TaxID=2952477 RepID=UPI002090D0A1|nr:AraC family transcriptional regulator [Rhizobium sp. SSA_523]MCO5734312.1 AraC family transcriptional regulator [Rhizobium sp. SSA_523]WKC21028.1 AraC family transcriptional regulator [Rhizobium sp. SSA_523]
MATDPLAEVVTLLQPEARFSKLIECAGSWKFHRKGTGDPFYCAVLEGQCRVTVDGEPPLILQAGDFLLVPAMRNLTKESVDLPQDYTTGDPIEISAGFFRVGSEGDPPNLSIRIGHCSFGSPDVALLVPLLPQVVLARGESRLTTLTQLVDEETRARRPARELVLERLLEVLLIEALRCGSEMQDAPPGLARGLADERVAASLRAFHARPESPWTIAGLALEASLSRSAFFARFSRTVGMPPMEYLSAWRMALAGRLLRGQELCLDEVAQRVGYSSSSSFSVAFARYAGISPSRYGRTF